MPDVTVVSVRGRRRNRRIGVEPYPAWELTWDYSASGNRTAQNAVVGNPPASALSFDAATNRVNTTGWTHDLSGNVTATPDGGFAIGAAGQTIGHTPATGPAISYAFDASGLRTKRTEGSSTTVYLRDGGQVIGEWNGTAWTREYVWLGNTLLATIEGSAIKYHHSDHLSARATTFADPMDGEEQGHYPFGEPWYETSQETTRVFTTYERETSGKLDYAMFRWMGPEAGRFLSADPVPGSMGDGQSWNRYAYAGNDPVNRWDPWGLETKRKVQVHEVHTVWGGGGGKSYNAFMDGGIYYLTEEELCRQYGVDIFMLPCNSGAPDTPLLDPRSRERSDADQGTQPKPCGLNPVTGQPGINAVASGVPGEVRPGVGGSGFFGEPRKGYAHAGLDIAGTQGSPVVANRNGRVELSGGMRGYGYSVVLVHDGGVRTLYAHLDSAPDLRVGSKVAQGAVVGSVGRSGNARGLPSGETHLHFGVATGAITSTAGTSWLDPAAYLNNPCP